MHLQFSKSVIRGFDHVTKIYGGLSSEFTCISYEKSDFLIPCPELIRVSEIIISICHVLHCPYLFLHLFPVVILDILLWDL